MHSPLRHLGALFSRKRPVHLTYFVTARCNARCPFCFYEIPRDAADLPAELALGEIRRIARSMDDLLWVLFSGGEVFLREDLVEVSGIFHDENRAAFLTYPTNGSLPETIVRRTEEILRRCPESVVVVKLSLDGVGPAHDTLRQSPGAFDRVLRTYQGLAALSDRHSRLALGINTLFCAQNQSRMVEVIDFVRGLDRVQSHTLTLVRGPLRDARSLRIDPALYQAAVRHLDDPEVPGTRRFHRFLGARFKAAQDRLQRQWIQRALSQRRRQTPCYAGRLNLVLSESGALSACEGLRQEPFGNVREVGYDVQRLLRSERARQVLQGIERGACQCTHECNALTNILFNPRMVPQLLREYAGQWLGPGGRRDAAGHRHGAVGPSADRAARRGPARCATVEECGL